MSWPWDELGLDGPASLKEVRQAYAKRLKETHPEEDSEGFQRLHEAYQAARQAARGHSPGRPRGELEEDASRDTTLDFSSLEEEAPKPAPQEAKGETFDFDALLEQEEVKRAGGRRRMAGMPLGFCSSSRPVKRMPGRRTRSAGRRESRPLRRPCALSTLCCGRAKALPCGKHFLLLRCFFR